MIDNEGTKPLPQRYRQAQVVYEAVVEYGITRIMAVFWNVNPDNRSSQERKALFSGLFDGA